MVQNHHLQFSNLPILFCSGFNTVDSNLSAARWRLAWAWRSLRQLAIPRGWREDVMDVYTRNRQFKFMWELKNPCCLPPFNAVHVSGRLASGSYVLILSHTVNENTLALGQQWNLGTKMSILKLDLRIPLKSLVFDFQNCILPPSFLIFRRVAGFRQQHGVWSWARDVCSCKWQKEVCCCRKSKDLKVWTHHKLNMKINTSKIWMGKCMELSVGMFGSTCCHTRRLQKAS